MGSLNFDEINFLPNKEDKNIVQTIAALGLVTKPFYVDVIPDCNAINGDCFINVCKRVETLKGEAVYGWQFAEYSFMIEAKFHAIWKSPDGLFIDVTPDSDPNVRQILFAIDNTRTFVDKRTDNFRLNTTSNQLVDDIIEIEHAKFILSDNAKQVDDYDRVIFDEKEALRWQNLESLSVLIDNICRQGGTISSKCFCNSGLPYKDCHRNKVKEYLSEIL